MEFIVRPIEKEEREKFFQLAEEMGSVFASSTWIEFQPNCILLGIFRSDGQLAGGCAVQESKLKIFKILVNPGFSPNCGFFLKQEASQNAQRIATIKAGMKALISYIGSLGYPLVDISFGPEIQDVQVFQWDGFRVQPAYTYRLNLEVSEEELWGGIHSSRRNRIKKLEAEGVHTVLTSNPGEVSDIITRRLESKSLNFDSQLCSHIISKSLKNGTGIAILAKDEHSDVSASFGMMLNEYCYYLFGGTRVGNSDQGASLSLWHLILEAKKQGKTVFDFEGSMVPSIEQFFRSFGGELVQYHRIKKASLWMEGLLRILKPGYWN